MNAWDWIIVLAVAAAVVLACRSVWRRRKTGRCCDGSCAGCAAGCARRHTEK